MAPRFPRLPTLLVPFALTACGNPTSAVLAPDGADAAATDANAEASGCALRDVEFTNEEPILIRGYDLDAMEVDLSPDGQVLMWNDNNSSGAENKNLHWARRVTDTVFQYEGEVRELNTGGVDGTPSFDQNGVLYYTSTGDYTTNGFKSLYRATRQAGLPYQRVVIDGLYGGMGYVSLDPDVSSNGTYLYYSLFKLGRGRGLPEQSNLRGAIANGRGSFARLDETHLAQLNTELLEYAPTISNDGRELYFTRANRASGTILGIYRSVRADTSRPFAPVETPVAAITGVVEAPAFNADETALYYHRKDRPGVGVYRVYRVTRSLPPACR